MTTAIPSVVRSITQMRIDGAKTGLALSLAGALSAPLSALLSNSSGHIAWLVDLAAHWQWLYLVMGATSALVLLRRGEPLWTLPALAVIALSWSWSSAPADRTSRGEQQSLTVVSANLNVDNPNPVHLQRWAETLKADIIVIQEVSPTAALELERWQSYPYRVITAQESPFGLAILSRQSILVAEALETDGQPLRYRAHLEWQGTRIALAAVHPVPPIGPEYHRRRAQLLGSESEWARASGLPALVVGDMNATPWSSGMRRAEAAGLRRATGLTPTWPAMLPMIPIDHVLADAAWHVLESGVGPNIGSDHRPVYAVLRPATR